MFRKTSLLKSRLAVPSISRAWQARYATGEGKKLSPTVTQGMFEEDAPQPVGQPKDVPAQSHPYRYMEVESTVPNEKTAEWIPDQVPNMPGGKGKYPDPLASEAAKQMVPGDSDTRSTRKAGTRPEADALPVNPKEAKVVR
jgi:hypothetical protein